MDDEFLPLFKKPNIPRIEESLEQNGLAVEYFPAFEQREHDFHSHGFIEILYVVKGHFRHIMADSVFEEQEGNLTILNFNQYHSLITPGGPVELFNIYLDPQKFPMPTLPAPLDYRLLELIPLHPELGNRVNRITHIALPDPQSMTALLQLLLREQASEGPGSSRAVEALFSLILLELTRAAAVPERVQEPWGDRRIEKVLLYLENRVSEKIKLDELCTLSGLKRSNLCKRFKVYTGMNISAYLSQRRLAIAIQRLRNGNDKILTIALDAGFSDISRFNRIFRRAFGCTPSEYREGKGSSPSASHPQKHPQGGAY